MTADKLIPVDGLVLPEKPEFQRHSAKIDRLLLDLEESGGFYLNGVSEQLINSDWQTVENYLSDSSLVNLRELLAILFPTLSGTTLAQFRQAFCLDPALDDPEALFTLLQILSTRAAKLPRGAARLLRSLTGALPEPLSDWIRSRRGGHLNINYETDPNSLRNFDRLETLTSGFELTDQHVFSLFEGEHQLTALIDQFERRRGQARYARAVSRALRQSDIVLLEAATGTGKSIGYLLPLIAQCLQESARGLVVTRTKSLQEQLFCSDLRKMRALLPPDFKIALLKGMTNYLCRLKYSLFLSELAAIPPALAASVAALIVWESETDSGDLTESSIFNEPQTEPLLRQITFDDASCLGANCAFFNECFAFRARKQAAKSDLVITNYALLLADTLANGNILGRFSYAVFDEAHRLEEAAISAFTMAIPLRFFARAVERLTLPAFAGQIKALVGDCSTTAELCDLIRQQCSGIAVGLQSLTGEISEQLRQNGRSESERVGLIPGERPYTLIADHWYSRREGYQTLNQVLTELEQIIPQLKESDSPDALGDLKRHLAQVVKYCAWLKAIAANQEEKLLVWCSLHRKGEIVISAVPHNVGGLLAEQLYRKFDAILFTSATLDSGDQFQWTKERLGLTEENGVSTSQLSIPSPFPIEEQLHLAVARYLPSPTAEQYPLRLAQLIAKFRRKVHLPTIVLCTSYRMIEMIEESLTAEINLPGELLVQRSDTSPQTLLSHFRRTGNPLLIGTESFWEGIDLPDDLLRVLFLTRLPFPVPSEPLQQARENRARERGENPFATVSLPTAVLKLRQGIGRMIRNSGDWGAVVITDSRMGTKNYGRVFYDALPVAAENYDHESLLLRDTADWLTQKRGQ